MSSQTERADLARRLGGSAVAMLRRETRVAHRRLEQELGLLSPDLVLDGYCGLLVGFAAVHQPLDDELAAQLGGATGPEPVDDLDLEARRRMPALARDLDRLGVPLPRPVAFPLPSVPAALGALYVSEGSMLGGRVIGPHVRAVLGRDTPVDFFESPGVDVPARWASCRRVIDQVLITRSDRTDAARAAVALFDRFREVLVR